MTTPGPAILSYINKVKSPDWLHRDLVYDPTGKARRADRDEAPRWSKKFGPTEKVF